VDSFQLVAGLCGLDRPGRVWVPGPVSASMNAYAVCLADQVGAALVDGPADATHLFCTPAALAALVGVAHRPLTVVVAGDRLSPTLADRAEAAGHTVHHYYGAAQLSFVGWGRDAASLRLFPEVAVEVVPRELHGDLDGRVADHELRARGNGCRQCRIWGGADVGRGGGRAGAGGQGGGEEGCRDGGEGSRTHGGAFRWHDGGCRGHGEAHGGRWGPRSVGEVRRRPGVSDRADRHRWSTGRRRDTTALRCGCCRSGDSWTWGGTMPVAPECDNSDA
jgi:hypothetical protein